MKKFKKRDIPSFDSYKAAALFHMQYWRIRFYIVFVIIILICLAGKIGILNEETFNLVIMASSVVLFCLSLPLSLILGLDNILKNHITDNIYLPLLIGLLFVFFNFMFIACYLAGWRLLRQRLLEIKKGNQE